MSKRNPKIAKAILGNPKQSNYYPTPISFQQKNSIPCRNVRVVECARLENEYAFKGHRRFESAFLRQIKTYGLHFLMHNKKESRQNLGSFLYLTSLLINKS